MSGLGTSFVVLDLCHVKCKRIDVEKRGKLRDSLVCALLYVKNVTSWLVRACTREGIDRSQYS